MGEISDSIIDRILGSQTMGEIADGLIDLAYNGYDSYWSNPYDENEEFDVNDPDQEGYFSRADGRSYRRYSKEIKCRYCGNKDVHWENRDGWKLVTPSGKIHSCSASSHKTKCKHCGIDGLGWKKIDGKWRLFNKKGKQHSCLRGV